MLCYRYHYVYFYHEPTAIAIVWSISITEINGTSLLLNNYDNVTVIVESDLSYAEGQ